MVVLNRLLIVFELNCFLQDVLLVSLCESGSEGIQDCFLFSLIFRSLCIVRAVAHLQKVLVLDQMLLNEAFEQTTFSEVFANASRVFIDLEHVKGVASVQGVRNHMGDVHQAGVLLGFLRSKLHLVKSLLKQACIDAVFADVFKRGEEHIFDFLIVISLDALNTDCEASLRRRAIKTGTRAHLWCDLSLNDRLVKWRVRSLEEESR